MQKLKEIFRGWGEVVKLTLKIGAGSAVVGLIWTVTENLSTSKDNEKDIDKLELAEDAGLVNDHLVFLRMSRIELGDSGEMSCKKGLRVANQRLQNIQKQITKLNKGK